MSWEDAKGNLADIQSILDLRNRLAHFKDNPTPLDLNLAADSLPEPELVRLLSGDKLKRRISQIAKSKKWIDVLFGVKRTRTIRLQKTLF